MEDRKREGKNIVIAMTKLRVRLAKEITESDLEPEECFATILDILSGFYNTQIKDKNTSTMQSMRKLIIKEYEQPISTDAL